MVGWIGRAVGLAAGAGATVHLVMSGRGGTTCISTLHADEGHETADTGGPTPNSVPQSVSHAATGRKGLYGKQAIGGLGKYSPSPAPSSSHCVSLAC